MSGDYQMSMRDYLSIAQRWAVASILTSLGMVMVSPMMFSLPLKLVVFALADGWSLLAASLVNSFKVT